MEEEFFIPKIGYLNIKEIYVYYDFPRFFLAENKTGNKFLGLSIEENEDHERWFYLPISLERLDSLKNKAITIYTAFKESEDSFLWDVKNFYEKPAFEVEIIECLQIPDNFLPKQNKYLNYSNNEKEEDKDLIHLSHSRAREILDITLKKENNSTEIEADILAKTLLVFQNLINYVSIKNNEKIKLSDNQKEKTKMMVTSTYKGSFGIRLESTQKELSLFDINKTGDYSRTLEETLDLLLDLFIYENTIEKINLIFKDINPFARSKYRLLLTHLKQSKLDIKLDYGSYEMNKNKKGYLNRDNIKNILLSIKKQNLKDTYIDSFLGYLIGGNLENNNFEFSTLSKESIKGKISSNFNHQNLSLSKDKICRINVEVEIQVNEVTQDEELLYTLISVDELNNDDLKVIFEDKK